MTHTRPGLALLSATLFLSTLAGCAYTRPVAHPEFKIVGERTYKDMSFDHMYTLALRTIRDMHLTKETLSKDEAGAFLVFQVLETDYSEMAMDLRPDASDTRSTHVTMFAHTSDDKTAAGHILDDLDEQIAIDRDPLHKKHQ